MPLSEHNKKLLEEAILQLAGDIVEMNKQIGEVDATINDLFIVAPPCCYIGDALWGMKIYYRNVEEIFIHHRESSRVQIDGREISYEEYLNTYTRPALVESEG